MADSIDFSFELDSFVDRFEELKFFAVFAGKLINTIDGDDGFQCPFDWNSYRENSKWGPEAFVKKDLWPFLMTLQTRLPELHKLLKDTLEQCHEGCAFGKHSDSEETEDGRTPEEIAEREATRKRDELTFKQVRDMCEVTQFGNKSDANRERIAKLGRVLKEKPDEVLAFIESLEEPDAGKGGAEIDTSGEWLAPSCVLCINEDEKARFSEDGDG